MGKKVGFFEKVVTGLTGKTAEQRQADALLKNQILMKQTQAYRQEQMVQAENVGKARADWEAKQQIQNLGKPKPLFNLDIGEYGKLQKGFDPMTFGEGSGSFAHQQVKGKIQQLKTETPKLFNLSEAMAFEGGEIGVKNVVRGKMRKHRVKHHHHRKGKAGKKQSFTITMK